MESFQTKTVVKRLFLDIISGIHVISAAGFPGFNRPVKYTDPDWTEDERFSVG